MKQKTEPKNINKMIAFKKIKIQNSVALLSSFGLRFVFWNDIKHYSEAFSAINFGVFG